MSKPDYDSILDGLKKENTALYGLLREDIKKIIKINTPEQLEKKIKNRIYIKLFIFSAVSVIISLGLVFVISKFFSVPSTSFIVTDHSINDPDFIPDCDPSDFNLKGNTTGNLLNGGYITFQGDMIYISDDKALYKINKDGVQKTELLKQPYAVKISQMNIQGNYIYFLDENGYICRIRTDGKDKEPLLRKKMTDLCIYGQYIYCRNEDNDFYRINIDGSGRKRIYYGKVSGFGIYDDSIFIAEIKESGTSKVCRIFKTDLNGNNEKIIFKDAENRFYFDGNSLFALPKTSDNIRGLYSYNLENGKIMFVCDIQKNYNVLNNKIYFTRDLKNTDLDNPDSLYAIDSDGTDLIKITDKKTDYILCAQDDAVFIKQDGKWEKVGG